MEDKKDKEARELTNKYLDLHFQTNAVIIEIRKQALLKGRREVLQEVREWLMELKKTKNWDTKYVKVYIEEFEEKFGVEK